MQMPPSELRPDEESESSKWNANTYIVTFEVKLLSKDSKH